GWRPRHAGSPHARLRYSALRLSRATQRVRSLGHEDSHGSAGAVWRTGAPAAQRRSPKRSEGTQSHTENLEDLAVSTLNVGIIGTGGITLQNHLPGLALCRDVKVTALCDANPATLESARKQTGAPVGSTKWEEIVTRDDVHAVIIATPNFLHPPIAIAAARARQN